MKSFTNKTIFVGVDISKDSLDLALLKEDFYGSFKDKRVKNSLEGYSSIQKWLREKNIKIEDCLFCMEHTGIYGFLFFAWLSKMGIDFCVEPGLRIKRSIGMQRGKNDRIDARRIADYAYSHRAKLEPFTLPSHKILQIKQLLTYRDQLVKIQTALKNSLKSHEQYKNISGLDSISQDIDTQIKDYRERIKQIEHQIKQLIESSEQLKKNYELATSVKGIGFIIASFMIVTTNNFVSFQNGRKYACYTGIAPFANQSGSSIKGKGQVSNLANKKMKTLLSNGANVAYKCDPDISAYYNRKIKEGKDHKLVINSICCKLVNRVFAVIKRQTPYVNTYQQYFNT